MFKKILSIFIFIYIPILSQQNQFFISGKVLHSLTKEPLENCNIFVKNTGKGTSTDKYGKFKLGLPKGDCEIRFSFLGFQTQIKNIFVNKNITNLKILLIPKMLKGDEVEILGKKEEASIVVRKMISKDIQKMPTINSDVLRSVKVLPGVTTNTELSSGYNVRGGTFDENLIYLNGYEIYRPFLLRIGVEENQTTINPNMVESLAFYNGAFPVTYGDKMSSALAVDYTSNHSEKIEGKIHLSLLNLGLNLKNKIGKLNWNMGFRYANPSTFLNSLKTKGDYKPSYSDIQLFANYEINQSSEIEFFGLYADNKFDISPTNWSGNFGGLMRGDFRGVAIESDGDRTYSYINSLVGLKYVTQFSSRSKLKILLSKYWVNESEKYDLRSNIFYFPDAMQPDENRELLKSRIENGENSIILNSYRTKLELNQNINMHNLSLGAEYRISEITNKNFELFIEKGDSLLTEQPINSKFNNNYKLNSVSLFAEDRFIISPNLEMNFGLRYLYYQYSKENLISPRAYISWKLSEINSFKFSWGYYYQPPFINELRGTKTSNLNSQRAIHYVLGWENQVNEKLKFTAEIYYKDLENLIPFYFDEFRMVYTDKNKKEGYAFGLDMGYEGEIVEGMKSWIGYSYLDTKERNIGEKKYQRRLIDQTHTLQIFLQDKLGKHHNWQSHLRFLLGSGYLYYPRKLIYNDDTQDSFLDISFENPQEYFFYFRVDMGLSVNFDIGKGYNLTGIAEILNIFNQLNAGAYEWVHISQEFNGAIKIPHVLSKRFLNVKLELSF